MTFLEDPSFVDAYAAEHGTETPAEVSTAIVIDDIGAHLPADLTEEGVDVVLEQLGQAGEMLCVAAQRAAHVQLRMASSGTALVLAAGAANPYLEDQLVDSAVEAANKRNSLWVHPEVLCAAVERGNVDYTGDNIVNLLEPLTQLDEDQPESRRIYDRLGGIVETRPALLAGLFR